MKTRTKADWGTRMAAACGFSLLMIVVFPQWAAGADPQWRETYDLVMRWVNFVILAGVLVYFGRRPVTHLLRSQAARHREQIQELEARKAQALAHLAAVRQTQAESEARFIDITQRIVALGETQRDAIIADAQRESEMLIAEARRRIAFAMRSAKDRLRAEMVDLAVDRALDRLPREISDADNQHRLGVFFRGLEKMS
jgi:F-type H+-transporting ATPase subunit b